MLACTLLAACGQLPFSPKTPAPSPTLALSPLPTPAIGTPTPTPSPAVIRIWLPAQFDPAAKSPSGSLLRAQLDQFILLNPGVRLDVRVKALEGPGGMLDSLSAASAAATSALPDLVALPRPLAEAAALKGLLHPFDGLTHQMENSDWYDYARQLSRLQNSTIGIPFAGDALLLVYRSTIVNLPPHDWASILRWKIPFAFPGADPQALFTLAQYSAIGGPIQDDQGRPTLDAALLAKVLTFFEDGEKSGLMPAELAGLESFDQAWNLYTGNQAHFVVTWASQYLQEAGNLGAGTAAEAIPTQDGAPFTLATGWVWAMGSAQADKQVLSARLVEHLSEPGFLAKWTQAAGYLPPRTTALKAWPDTPTRSLAGEISLSAHLSPSPDLLASLGPLFREATVSALKRIGDPLPLAKQAVDRLNNP